MAFGGLGGLGGFSPSFPQRIGAPISNIVENLPFASREDWLADWQARYNQEAAKAQAGPGYWRDTRDIRQASMGQVGGTNTIGGPSSTGGPSTGVPTGNYELSSTTSAGGPTVNLYETTPVPSYMEWVEGQAGTPDFTALNEERARLDPRFTAQVGNQQAYDNMLGMHQMNGIPGPDYANANFGRVTGQQNQPLTPQQGVDMSWASGVYDPNYASGMFGNSGGVNPGFNPGWL